MTRFDPKRWATTWSVPLLATALYLGTLSRNLSISHDAIEHLVTIESGWSFHANHLLHAVIARGWLLTWRALGCEADSTVVVASLSALCGGAALLVLGHLLRERLGLPPLAAAMACAAWGGTFAVGYHASSVAVYALPLPAALLALDRMCGRWTPGRAAIAGLCCAVAVLLHQMYVLLAVAMAARAALEARRGTKGAVIPLVAGLATLAAGVAVPYALVAQALQGSPVSAEATHWALGHASRADYWSWPAVDRAALGFARAWIGGHFALAIPSVAQLADDRLAAHYLADEHHLVRGLSPSVAVALLAVAAAAALAAVGLLARGARRVWRASTERPTAWLPLLAWAATCLVFFLCWMPELPEFWSFASLTLCAALAAAVTRAGQRPDRAALGALALIALSLWCVNLLGTVRFARDPARDLYAARVAPLCGRAGPDDLIIAGRCWMQRAYLQRCSAAKVVCLADLVEKGQPHPDARLLATVDEHLAGGATVYWLDDAVTAEPAAVVRHGPALRTLTEAWTPYRERWLTLEEGPRPIYVLRP